jgi:phosphatidylserine decarboxylase
MIAQGGLKIIYITTIILIILLITCYFFSNTYLKIITVLAGVIFIYNFYFFRDPERKIPLEDNIILSPADGTIIKIAEVEEPYYFKQKVTCVSIFLSIFNIHVNRIPISGKVDYFQYNRGKFLPAFNDKASKDNEQTVIGIKNSKVKILFKQIAGIIARRVVCNVKEGDSVTVGQRFGIIRYGSRVDIFLPENVELKIKNRDKVKGGLTIIGKYK